MVKIIGSGLMEMLVSLSLISILLLNFDALQLHSLRQINTAYQLALANQQLQNLSEILHAASTTDVSSLTAQWIDQTKMLLPTSIPSVQGSFPNYNLTICWDSSTFKCEKIMTAF